MLSYKRFISFLVPVLNQPLIRLLLTLISLAFYFVSLDLMSSLTIIIKRRLSHLLEHLRGKEFSEDQRE
jgi:hypothetical protein